MAQIVEGGEVKAPRPLVLSPTFALLGVQPPAYAYLSPDDFLLVGAAASAAGKLFTASGRILRTDGQVIPFSYTITPTGTRAASTQIFPLEEGFLLSVELFANGANFGQTVGRLEIVKGTAVGLQTGLMRLVQGPVNNFISLGWPMGDRSPTASGQGMVYAVAGTAPAAGAEVSQTVPTAARWRLKGMVVALTTAVAVATRAVTVVIDDGTNQVAIGQAQTTQLASLTRTYHLDNSGGAVDLTAPNIPVFMPVDIPLLAGWRIRTVTTNLQAADAYGTPIFYVEEWIEII